MTLQDLMMDLDVLEKHGPMELAVTGLAYDSRRVRPGDVFFGLSGLKQDGQAYARQAQTAGAVAVVVEKDIHAPGITRVRVGDTRSALAQASARFFGFPSRDLVVVGVTGTNGKTTLTYLLDAVFRALGRSTGVIGTTGYVVAGERRAAPFTTPEAPELQQLLAEMRARGATHVSLELSSHALEQKRCLGLDLDVAIFTNLSHDHLDFHGTMEAYLDAKLRLFDGRNQPRPAKSTVAVVNADDRSADAVCAAASRGGMRVECFSADPGRAGDNLLAQVVSIAPAPEGLDLEIDVHGRGGAGGGDHVVPGRQAFRLPLLGRHNASNAAGAFAACLALGMAPEQIARGLAAAGAVPGRLERVRAGQPFTVAVDYAHTPDALAHAIDAVREHTPGRVLVVFGCGGDRDRAKRPVMGAIAAARADRAWVTSDNPRSEDARAIADEVVAGESQRLAIELDRERAIAAAFDAAAPGDAVLIAGKGHETTQTFADRVVPFDDREVARALLARRTWT